MSDLQGTTQESADGVTAPEFTRTIQQMKEVAKFQQSLGEILANQNLITDPSVSYLTSMIGTVVTHLSLDICERLEAILVELRNDRTKVDVIRGGERDGVS